MAPICAESFNWPGRAAGDDLSSAYLAATAGYYSQHPQALSGASSKDGAALGGDLGYLWRLEPKVGRFAVEMQILFPLAFGAGDFEFSPEPQTAAPMLSLGCRLQY